MPNSNDLIGAIVEANQKKPVKEDYREDIMAFKASAKGDEEYFKKAVMSWVARLNREDPNGLLKFAEALKQEGYAELARDAMAVAHSGDEEPDMSTVQRESVEEALKSSDAEAVIVLKEDDEFNSSVDAPTNFGAAARAHMATRGDDDGDDNEDNELLDELSNLEETMNEALEAAQSMARTAELAGNSRLAGEIESYLIGHLQSFIENENQMGSVASIRQGIQSGE